MYDEPIPLPSGYTLHIGLELYPETPLDAESDVGLAYCWHNRYNLGHYKENKYERPHELLASLWRRRRVPYRDRSVPGLEARGFMFVNLYLLDHSGITMSTHPYSCPWDSGQVGWWVLTPGDIRRRWKGDREKARDYVDASVQTYAEFLEGAVYMFSIKDADGNVIDSCSGFYGYDHAASGLYEAAGYSPSRKLSQEKNLCSMNSR